MRTMKKQGENVNAVFGIKKIPDKRGKHSRWAERWIVFEKLSGKNLTVHRFISKSTAERAIAGTHKRGAHIMCKALRAHNDASADKTSLRVLVRYFQKHRTSEGYGTEHKAYDAFACCRALVKCTTDH
jgi:hypothetical protein